MKKGIVIGAVITALILLGITAILLLSKENDPEVSTHDVTVEPNVVETIKDEPTNVTDELPSAVGYVKPIGTVDIPDVVANSNAWKEFSNSEFFVPDLLFHYETENYVISNYYGDDFDIIVECINGECVIKVSDSSYNTLALYE